MSGYDPQRTRRRPVATRANAQAVESLLGEAALPPKPVRADHDARTTTTDSPPKPVRPHHDATTAVIGPDVSSLSARTGCLGVLLGLGRR